MPQDRYHPGDEWQIAPLHPRAERAPVQRVALVTEAFLPKLDGVSKLTALTARHHLNMGRQVMILAPSLRLGDHCTPPDLDGARVISVPSGHLPPCPAESRFGLPYLHLRALADFQPDLVHLFSPAMLAWTGVRYARRHSLPLVANYQTDLPGYMRRYGVGLLEPVAWAYVRHLHRHATLNLAPTRVNLADLQARGFENLRLWYRGCDTRRFSPARRSAAMRARLLDGRPASSMIVLYVGRLANEKRVDLLRQVAQVPGVAVAIVGDGPTRPDLEQLFGHTATFLGFLTGEELAQAYASADVFGFTGTNEVAGQVVKEAMASGLPVLVPDSGGIVDYVMEGVNGHVCAIDSAAYAAQVVRLRDNPARRRQMGQNALAYARRLSWEDSMAELEKLYAEAVHLNARQQRLRDRLRTRMRSAAGALVPRLRPN